MNLNPFDLRGPDFLLFYATLVAVTAFLVWWLLYLKESNTTGDAQSVVDEIAKDPYQIAFLRGGRDEVVRVAVVSLLERGLLTADGTKLATASSDAAKMARRPLDRAILTKFLKKRDALSILSDSILQGEASVIGEPLKEMKLLPDSGLKATRTKLLVAGVAFLWLIAGMKINIAVSRGHSNFIFLIVMAVIAPFILSKVVSSGTRTALGNHTLSKLNEMFSRLSSLRPSATLPGNLTSVELTYLAALYGMTALPSSMQQIITPWKTQPPPTAHNGGGSGWHWNSSSSCGGGSSCSGGSSCGGGGGCGGCGG